MSDASPYIRAFGVSYLRPNTLLNIRDVSDKPIGNIEVTIRSGGQVFRAVPGSKGYFRGYSVPSVISSLAIDVKGFRPVREKFILTNKVFLRDPESALVVKIHDPEENPVEDAEVTVSSITETNTYTTDETGMAEAEYTEGFENTVTVKKEGFVDHRFVIPFFTKVVYDNMAFVAVPVINLQKEPEEL